MRDWRGGRFDKEGRRRRRVGDETASKFAAELDKFARSETAECKGEELSIPPKVGESIAALSLLKNDEVETESPFASLFSPEGLPSTGGGGGEEALS